VTASSISIKRAVTWCSKLVLARTMAPEAREKMGRAAGLATVLGFALAVALSTSS
jgi:hypothetical protein